MLNRYTLALEFEYIFDNLENLDFMKVYNFMHEDHKVSFTDDVDSSVNDTYFRILYNKNYNMLLSDQILYVKNFLDNFIEFLESNNLYDLEMENKLNFMKLEFSNLEKYLIPRIPLRNMKIKKKVK